MESRSWNTKLLVGLSLVILSLGLFLLWYGMKSTPEVSDPLPIPEIVPQAPEATTSARFAKRATYGIEGERVLVTDVVDGDTIKVEGNITIRLLGIDTPETKDPRKNVQCFGKEASNKLKELIEEKEVILEKDVSETDKYKRLLRYIYLPLENNQLLFVNDYLIREGFARVLTYPPDVKYTEEFLEAQQEAKEKNKGLWGRC